MIISNLKTSANDFGMPLVEFHVKMSDPSSDDLVDDAVMADVIGRAIIETIRFYKFESVKDNKL